MRFRPGQSGNPKGRPKVGTSLSEYIRLLGGANGKAYVDKLHAIATEEHPNVNARMQACQILLERGFGKPVQPVTGEEGAGPVVIKHVYATASDAD